MAAIRGQHVSAAALADFAGAKVIEPLVARPLGDGPPKNVQGVLRSRDVPVSEARFAEALNQVLATTEPLSPVDPRNHLSDREIGDLEQAGLVFSSADEDVIVHGLTARGVFAILLAESPTVKESAEILHMSPGEVEKLLQRRELYGFVWQHDWRIPAFQFADGEIVRGLSKVVPHIPRDMHPVAVWRWFVEPNDGFEGDEASPLDWLRQGRDPDAVCELADSLLVS
jgi:hypothetical protein